MRVKLLSLEKNMKTLHLCQGDLFHLLFSFYTPWKHQKIKASLTLSGGIIRIFLVDDRWKYSCLIHFMPLIFHFIPLMPLINLRFFCFQEV